MEGTTPPTVEAHLGRIEKLLVDIILLLTDDGSEDRPSPTLDGEPGTADREPGVPL